MGKVGEAVIVPGRLLSAGPHPSGLCIRQRLSLAVAWDHVAVVVPLSTQPDVLLSLLVDDEAQELVPPVSKPSARGEVESALASSRRAVYGMRPREIDPGPTDDNVVDHGGRGDDGVGLIAVGLERDPGSAKSVDLERVAQELAGRCADKTVLEGGALCKRGAYGRVVADLDEVGMRMARGWGQGDTQKNKGLLIDSPARQRTSHHSQPRAQRSHPGWG